MSGLQQCGRPEALELVSLLGRYEVEGLLYAHDRIAEVGAISTAPLSDAALSTALLDATISSSDVGMDTMMQESAFISSSLSSTGQYSPAHSAHSQDRTFKIIRLEKSNEPLVIDSFKYIHTSFRLLNRFIFITILLSGSDGEE